MMQKGREERTFKNKVESDHQVAVTLFSHMKLLMVLKGGGTMIPRDHGVPANTNPISPP